MERPDSAELTRTQATILGLALTWGLGYLLYLSIQIHALIK